MSMNAGQFGYEFEYNADGIRIKAETVQPLFGGYTVTYIKNLLTWLSLRIPPFFNFYGNVSQMIKILKSILHSRFSFDTAGAKEKLSKESAGGVPRSAARGEAARLHRKTF